MAKAKTKPTIAVGATARGFALGEFIDGNGVPCSIQKSSAACRDMLWLGADEIGLKQLRPGRGGWVDIPTPDHQANTRMHLTRENVKALLPLLRHFARTGDLP